MIREYVTAATLSGVVAFVAAAGLHAPDPTIAVAAVASTTALGAWISSSRTTQDAAGLALSNPAWALALGCWGRRRWSELLPLWASQVVGALAAGLVVQALSDRLPDPLVWASADPVTTGVVGFVLATVAAWAVVGADWYLSDGLTALPVVATGAMLPVNLVGMLSPASVFGVTVAGLLDIQTAAIAVVAVLLGSGLGGWTGSIVAAGVD